MYTGQEIQNASNSLGQDLSVLPIRRQNMLVTIYHYNEGWIDEKTCEDRLANIFKNIPLV